MTDETASDDDGGGRAWTARVRRLVRARPKTALAATAAVAVLAAGVGTWAAGIGPFEEEDRYCWGAWEEGSGPEFLSDGDGSRTSEETAPTAKRPRGRCTVAIRSEHAGSTGTYVSKAEVTVTYGPAPGDAAKRVEWLDTYLSGSAVPLPDGLPGAVDGDRGLLVLPERCDTPDGRPTAVTLDSDARTDWNDGVSVPDGAELGGTRSVAALLVAAANRGMEAAGCAPAKPLRVTSPVLTLAEKKEDFFTRACRINGMELDEGTSDGLAYQVGAVTRDFQSCSVRLSRGADRFFDALMVAQPRLAALLDGVTGDKPPARGWRGTGVFTDTGGYKVVRAECAGRPVTLVALAPATRETTPYFVAFANSVTQRLGCAPIAPGGAGR
ncbi:hypothetical protein [Streptomyces sp. XD-27]|uniref:hypothetical protein n=1 Tax=Streptomyces sp. XD-27 TaxID=3062779 RepID=UPI0026F40B80|nr:hypothetical protein [Streptomyces sp. XD-27]WKX73954.1 hypothetical protein Q3Y56_32435 [Streptomyces sp. XD-27]